MKHTPGPWTLEDVMGDGLCDICGPDVPDEGSPNMLAHAFREADARLIAAAPDLLEALESMYALHTGEHGEAYIEAQAHALEKAEAAIAKAEGK